MYLERPGWGGLNRVEEYGEDVDDAIVPNLESLRYTAGYDWLVTVFGPTLLVLSMDEEDLDPVTGRNGPRPRARCRRSHASPRGR